MIPASDRDPNAPQAISTLRQWLTVHEIVSIVFTLLALVVVALFARKAPNPVILAVLVVAAIGLGLLSFYWAARQ